MRPPTEVKFFTPCHFGNFQKFLMSRKIQIDESVIFVSVICHRRSDTNSRIIFFSVHLQTLALKFSSALTSIGIIFSPSSINKSILQLLRYGVFEFFEYVIAVKQYVFAYAYHTIQQAALWNKVIIIFFKRKVLKIFPTGISIYKKCQSSIYGFSIILKFEIYIFGECSDFEIKKGSGEISPPSRFC